MIRSAGLRTPAALLALTATALLSWACASAATPSPSAESSRAPIALASAAATASATPSTEASPSAESSGIAAASSEATAVPTSIDPCQLIPKEEASQLAGATFGAGKEEETSGHAKLCAYGAGTTNVFEVIVAMAPDVATAQAQEQSAIDDLKKAAADLPSGLHITQLPNFAPGADAVLMDGSVSLGGQSIDGRGIYVLRGTSFFGFNNLVRNGKAVSEADAKTEAMTVLGRLP